MPELLLFEASASGRASKLHYSAAKLGRRIPRLFGAGAGTRFASIPASQEVGECGRFDEDFQALSALGVKMMIDLASEGDPAEEAHAREAGMRFVRIPMSTHEAPSAKVIAQFLSLVNDPANQPVYVHCIGGRHRTGVMTAIYRMTDFGWNWTQAFGEMKKYKYGAEFLHPEFKAFLETYVPTVAAAPSAVSAPK